MLTLLEYCILCSLYFFISLSKESQALAIPCLRGSLILFLRILFSLKAAASGEDFTGVESDGKGSTYCVTMGRGWEMFMWLIPVAFRAYQ